MARARRFQRAHADEQSPRAAFARRLCGEGVRAVGWREEYAFGWAGHVASAEGCVRRHCDQRDRARLPPLRLCVRLWERGGGGARDPGGDQAWARHSCRAVDHLQVRLKPQCCTAMPCVGNGKRAAAVGCGTRTTRRSMWSPRAAARSLTSGWTTSTCTSSISPSRCGSYRSRRDTLLNGSTIRQSPGGGRWSSISSRCMRRGRRWRSLSRRGW
mmetsp:Transcript_56011/g.98969  ORF Transcript_56011/g.98969 Transcript_56011/m.98969 type:complete len:214 (-) Transcript_56011:498-1139(-)